MSHMVIYRGTDGKPGYHQTDDIHDAVGFVESMRNDQGVEHARIFRLEEVVFQYKPYYRVELADSMGESYDEQAAVGTGAPAPSNGNGNGTGGGELNGATDYDLSQVSPGDVSAYDLPPVEDLGQDIDIDDGSAASGSGSKRGLFGR